MSRPLRLTPFERYMLEDDQPEYPMVFHVRCRMLGVVHPQTLQAALERALPRHPLLQSVVAEENGTLVWKPAEALVPEVHWNHSDSGACPTAKHARLDIRQSIGLRIWVDQHDREAMVQFEFHHACTDGIGAVQFLEDLWVAYASLAAEPNKRPALKPLNPGLLKQRGGLVCGLMGRWFRLPIELLATFGVLQFFVNRPRPVATPGDSASHGQTTSQMVPHQRLTSRQLRELHRTAGRYGVTINDLLVRDLMLAVDAWNGAHAPNEWKPWLRVSVPVNLRLDAHDSMPAANVVSMVFIDRKPRSYVGPLKLLRSIRRDTFLIKRLRLATVFVRAIAIFQAILGNVGFMLRRKYCQSSVVLSNLGVQFDDMPLPYENGRAIVGNLVLDDIGLLPPVRPLTRVSIGVVTYAGKLTLAMQHDAKSLSSQAASDLLSTYLSRIAATAAGRATEPVVVPALKPSVVPQAISAQAPELVESLT